MGGRHCHFWNEVLAWVRFFQNKVAQSSRVASGVSESVESINLNHGRRAGGTIAQMFVLLSVCLSIRSSHSHRDPTVIQPIEISALPLFSVLFRFSTFNSYFLHHQSSSTHTVEEDCGSEQGCILRTPFQRSCCIYTYTYT
jgi:hypothetical protein